MPYVSITQGKRLRDAHHNAGASDIVPELVRGKLAYQGPGLLSRAADDALVKPLQLVSGQRARRGQVLLLTFLIGYAQQPLIHIGGVLVEGQLVHLAEQVHKGKLPAPHSLDSWKARLIPTSYAALSKATS